MWPFDPAFPPILDIARRAPQIAAGIFAPEPGFMGAPLADAQQDWTAGCIECLTDQCITCGRILRGRIAPVVFQVIHGPRGVLSGFLVFVSEAPRSAGASLASRIRINPELQAQRMDVICECFDPGREVLRISDDVAVFVTCNLPAIVDHNVLVTGILHARLHHGVGNLPDELFAYIAREFVPAIPSHRRRGRESAYRKLAFLGEEACTRAGQDENHQQISHCCLRRVPFHRGCLRLTRWTAGTVCEYAMAQILRCATSMKFKSSWPNRIVLSFAVLAFASDVLSQDAKAQLPSNQLSRFEAHANVGIAQLQGAVTFSAATGEYRITGGGANMWGQVDAFQPHDANVLEAALSSNVSAQKPTPVEQNQNPSNVH